MSQKHTGMGAALALAGLLALSIGCGRTTPAATTQGQAAPQFGGRGPAPYPPTPIRRPPLGSAWVQAHYNKQEVRIPMRDGVRLMTEIYTPKGASPSHKYPILMMRTPYSVRPYGADNYAPALGPAPEFAEEGYIFAYQDVRGCFMSEGVYVNMRPMKEHYSGPTDTDESTDTYDTVACLVNHVANNNGNVGQWGISYPGFYSDDGLIHANPHLKAVSPQAPVTDWFAQDDFHHNGVFWLPHAFSFFYGFGHPRPQPSMQGGRPAHPFDYGTDDGYEFYLAMGPLLDADSEYFHDGVPYWDQIMEHPNKDAWWQAQDLLPHLRDIKPAVLTVGGWFDAQNLYGAIQTFYHIEKNSPQTDNHVIMGPWYHGEWGSTTGGNDGAIPFYQPTADYFVKHVEQPFFDHYLKGTPEPPTPVATVFETGRDRWHQLSQWPPAGAKPASLFLHAGGKVSFNAPTAGEGAPYDEYISDPKKPVPFMNVTTIAMPEQYMIADQRYAGRRPDVLVYESDVLTQPVTVVGPVSPNLWVSTSTTDSDYVVKLIDVYPDRYAGPDGKPNTVLDGYQMMVRGDMIRGKYRDSLSNPQPFVPNQPTAVNFTTSDIYHTFLPGHRIMVQIQSTWFPLGDLNPQRFEDIYTAKASDFQKATERIYHTPALPSQIKILVLPQ